MEVVESYDHQPGVHCGATALRNVSRYYGWNDSEATCFGIGGGPAFVRYDHPEQPWDTFRTSPTWLERAYFERLGIPHLFRERDNFETAWENATAHVDDDDPVILYLDPSFLEYLPDDHHLPPHVVVMIGYDDETVQLSDGAVDEPRGISRETLADAWTHDRFVPLEREFLVVTRAVRTRDETDAVAAGLGQAATYMLEPLQIKRDARGPGAEGLPALRSFGEALESWSDLADPTGPVRAARRSIDEHGEGAAFRGLYADALEELGQRTGLAPALSDRMERVAGEWRIVADVLDGILGGGDPTPGAFAEAASIVGEIADREESIFEDIAAELGRGAD